MNVFKRIFNLSDISKSTHSISSSICNYYSKVHNKEIVSEISIIWYIYKYLPRHINLDQRWRINNTRAKLCNVDVFFKILGRHPQIIHNFTFKCNTCQENWFFNHLDQLIIALSNMKTIFIKIGVLNIFLNKNYFKKISHFTIK